MVKAAGRGWRTLPALSSGISLQLIKSLVFGDSLNPGSGGGAELPPSDLWCPWRAAPASGSHVDTMNRVWGAGLGLTEGRAASHRRFRFQFQRGQGSGRALDETTVGGWRCGVLGALTSE